jgi:Flp pilus assembly protein TadG
MKKVMMMNCNSSTHKYRANKKHGREVHGQGVLEFALALPVMLLLILGIIEFGRMMITYTALSSASREAARYGAAVGDDGAGTLSKFEDCDGIREAAKRVTDAFVIIEDANITIQYDRGPGTAFYASCSPDPDAVQLGDRIVVNVSGTYTPIIDFGFGDFTVVSESKRTIMKEIVLQ